MAIAVVGFTWTPDAGALDPAPRVRFINVFKTSPLVPVDLAKSPQFSVVGELELVETLLDGRVKTTMGSAVIVSPCYILTNHHVAFGGDFEPIAGKSYVSTFRAGTGHQPGTFAGKTIAKPVLWGELTKLGENDWAVMQLGQCVGVSPKFGWAESTNYSKLELARDKPPVRAVGYSARMGPNAQMSTSLGHVIGVDRKTGMVEISASVTPKQSGGAGFIIEDGRLKLALLLTAGKATPQDVKINGAFREDFNEWDKDHSNLGQSVLGILYSLDVKALLDSDKSRAPAGNPGASRTQLRLPL